MACAMRRILRLQFAALTRPLHRTQAKADVHLKPKRIHYETFFSFYGVLRTDPVKALRKCSIHSFWLKAEGRLPKAEERGASPTRTHKPTHTIMKRFKHLEDSALQKKNPKRSVWVLNVSAALELSIDCPLEENFYGHRKSRGLFYIKP